MHPTVQGAEKYMYSRAMAQRMNKSERGGKEATLHQAKGDGGREERSKIRICQGGGRKHTVPTLSRGRE